MILMAWCQTATKLRAFFMALLQPIRTSVTTNMQVVQTSIFLKYRSLFGFLQRQAANVAQEVQRAYVGAARTYYETGFRRYSRSLGWIKVRVHGMPTTRLLIFIRLEQRTNLKQLSQEQGRKTKTTLLTRSVWLMGRWMDRV